MKYVTLTEWDAETFSKVHSIRTLRAWAKSGQIQPAPIKVGREYMVESCAKFVPLPTKVQDASSGLLADPIVSGIYYDGAQTA